MRLQPAISGKGNVSAIPRLWVLLSVVIGAAAGVPDLQNRLIQNRAPGGRPHAQIETGRVFGTEGVLVQPREWIHVAAVKRGEEFLLYLDGEQQASAQVPA